MKLDSLNDLANQTCSVCRAGAPRLTDTEIKECLATLPAWQVVEHDEVLCFSRTLGFPDFKSALAFANRVGELAEMHKHHPLITIEWGKATVRWWTHSISGVHQNDAIMAAKTDALLTTDSNKK
jgi:4a-hydroxytetrahydrobiopterin dehydratase